MGQNSPNLVTLVPGRTIQCNEKIEKEEEEIRKIKDCFYSGGIEFVFGSDSLLNLSLILRILIE
jgi:hypothetical protein